MNQTFIKKPSVEKSSICITENNGEKVFRNINSTDNLLTGFQNYKSLSEILINCAKENPDKNLLGSRKIVREIEIVEEITEKKQKQYEFGQYEWKTTQQILDIVNDYAYGLNCIGLKNDGQTKIAIFADNCEEWFFSSQAILLIGCTIVTVYPTLPNEGIVHALNSTRVSALILDEKSVGRFLQFSNHLTHLSTLILMSSCNNPELYRPLFNKFSIYKINDLCEKGHELIDSNEKIDFQQTQDDDVALIMFTSGSTGNPKGVLLSHKNLLTQVGSEIRDPADWKDHTFIAFLPCAHILEFIVELSIIAYGGTIGYSHPLTLTNLSSMIIPGTEGDLRALKPTIAIFVPVLLDRVTKHVLRMFRLQTKYKQIFLQFLIEYKSYFIQMGHDTSITNGVIFSKLASILGGNLKVTLSAGAPLSSELSLFCTSVFCINLKQGYGTTETCCAGSLGRINEPYSFDAGSITSTTDIKLVSWEEGSYYTSDEPYPRGEIYIGGDSVALGYFEDNEQTQEAFEVDENCQRWFKSGDIGQILSNGNLQIIDRKKDIIKLKHGEYVSLSAIEIKIMQSKFVDTVCVLPNSDSSYLICLIVPNRPQIVTLLKMENIELNEDFSVHILDSSIRRTMQHDIDKITMTLNKFDKPQHFHFVTEIWSPENGFLTPSMKIKRPEIVKYYNHFLD